MPSAGRAGRRPDHRGLCHVGSCGSIDRVREDEVERVLAVVAAERARTARQIESLRRSVASIVEEAELTATDDEHDPEGATIAYERAQALALLRQATLDLEALTATYQDLVAGIEPACTVCGRAIGLARLEALPSARRCIRCAS